MIKTRILIILVCIALIGIIISQIYWLSQSYQISKTQFIKEVNISLNNYGIKNLKTNLNKVIEETKEQKGDSVQFDDYKLIERILTAMDLNFNTLEISSASSSIYLKSKSYYPDSNIISPIKAKSALDSIVYIPRSSEENSHKGSRHYLAIKEALLKSGINIPFEMALINKKLNKINWSSRNNPKEFSAIPLKSDIVSIALDNNNIQLAFKDESIFILKKMWQLLLVSIVLIFISGFTFFYLLKNIFSQKKLNVLKNDFINNITHELKTPLSTIGVAIEALQKFDVIYDKPKTHEYLNIANNEIFRINTLVDKVLKTSAFDHNNIKFNMEKLNLMDLSEMAIGNFKPQFEKHQVKFTASYNSNVIFVLADKLHFTNVIYNLIDNAIKYSPVKPEISYKITLFARRIFIEVKDNGIGISSNYTDRIFEKFFRVPTGNVHNVKGYGLGLSYVKGVLTGHNGSISVKSEQNRGTIFTIELPMYNE